MTKRHDSARCKRRSALERTMVVRGKAASFNTSEIAEGGGIDGPLQSAEGLLP